MSQRLTNILGYLTLFAILAAIWVLFGEDPTLNQGARGEPTFPELEERVNETARIILSRGPLKTTLTRQNGFWVIEERANYNAQGDKILALLRGLARSNRREPKTASNDRFDQIGLAGDALSISILDDAGDTITSLKMGSRKANAASGRSLTYIYKSGDTRSWLVSELAPAEADPAWWLDKRLPLVGAGRVRDFRYKTLNFRRNDEGALYQIIDGDQPPIIPEIAPDNLINALTTLEFADVQKLANPLDNPVTNGALKTGDGLSLTYNIFRISDGHWLQIAASFDASARDDGPAEILAGAPENGQEEADSINARTRGWLFKLTETGVNLLTSDTADYRPKPAEPEQSTENTNSTP